MKNNIIKAVLIILVAYFLVITLYNNIYMIFSSDVDFEGKYFQTLLSLYLEPTTAIEYIQSFFLTEWWFYWVLIPLALCIFLFWGLQDIFVNSDKYTTEDKFGIHGTAKWQDPLKLMNGKTLVKASKASYGNSKKTLNIPSGYILGRVPNKKKLLVMADDTDVDNQHMLVIGSSGASKSQSFVIPNLINVRDKSIIVTDPKGELYSMTAQLKADQGYKVYQVDFVTFMQSRYNPLTYVETDLQAQTVANTIISNFEGDSGGDNAFFKNNATNMLSALIIYVKSEYPPEKANMGTLVDVYTDYIQDEEVFREWFYTIPKGHPAKKMLASILDLTGNTRGSVTSVLNNGLSIFKLNKVQHMTSVSDFNFEDFVNEKAILYVKLSMENDTFNPITSVFFSQMIDVLYDIAKRSKGETLPRKVLLLLDEFANIGKLNNYSKVMSTSRSLGLILCTIIQNRAQLEKSSMYGKDEAKEIMFNHDIKIILRADQTDSDTTRWISGAIGNTTVKYNKKGMTKNEKSISKSDNPEHSKRALIDPEEVGRLKSDESIVIIAGHNPIIAKKAYQFKIYPDLITDKNRKLNYNNIRKELGFTGKLLEEKKYVIPEEKTFSEYQQEKSSRKKNNDDKTNPIIEESNNKKTKEEMFLNEMKSDIDNKIAELTDEINNEELTEDEIEARDSLINKVKANNKEVQNSTYNNVKTKTDITREEFDMYVEDDMNVERVEEERNKRNKSRLNDLDEDLNI